MDPSYETVVPIADLVWTMLVYVLHGVIAGLQVALALYLLGTGLLGLIRPELDGLWLRRLGVTPNTRVLAALRVGLGLILFAPLALGAPAALSILAAVSAVALLVHAERELSIDLRRPGRPTRLGAIAAAVGAACFMLWEGEDNIALSAELVLHMQEWRTEELEWQLSQDPMSPKVGDLAPDFELQDPEGVAQIRLSDFRGKRPVALVFGSYT
jgi:hypothetical protein